MTEEEFHINMLLLGAEVNDDDSDSIEYTLNHARIYLRKKGALIKRRFDKLTIWFLPKSNAYVKTTRASFGEHYTTLDEGYKRILGELNGTE